MPDLVLSRLAFTNAQQRHQKLTRESRVTTTLSLEYNNVAGVCGRLAT